MSSSVVDIEFKTQDIRFNELFGLYFQPKHVLQTNFKNHISNKGIKVLNNPRYYRILSH